MRPWCKAIPPIICTSKWRMPVERTEASRLSACAHAGVQNSLHFGFEFAHARDERMDRLYVALVASAENFCQKLTNHFFNLVCAGVLPSGLRVSLALGGPSRCPGPPSASDT